MSMEQLSVFFGAFRYEFRMQVRRQAVWITLFLIALLIVVIAGRTLAAQPPEQDVVTHLNKYPLLAVLAFWTNIVNTILPLGIGCLMADRLQRDRRTHVDELFTSMPGALSARIAGKYLGGIGATVLPVFVFYLIGIIYILIQTQNLLALPLSLVTFVVIVLPGTLFISAFSLACTSLLWVPLYQFLFICYWFWGNILSPDTGIPTISHTILTPIGDYIAKGIFGANVSAINATPQMGFASLFTLIGFALFALFVLNGSLKWRQARQ